MRRDSPRVKLLNAPKLIRLQARGVSNYVFYFPGPPSARHSKTGNENAKLPNRGALPNCIGRKLQEECCEQWVSDAGKVLSILLGDFASLIRLSITIRVRSQAPKTWEDNRTYWALARRIIAQ
jgi:hypothetical protein